MRNILFFVSLKDSTCNITDMLENTYIMPEVIIKSGFFEKTATLAHAAPNAREPVSPIIIFAG